MSEPRRAYQPFEPARRPGGKPAVAPDYRVLVHRKFRGRWLEIVDRVGVAAAQQFYEHVSHTPGKPDPIAQTCILRGRAGEPMAPGWSRTIHYELSSVARVNYQFHDSYTTSGAGDAHRVVAILTIDYTSH